MYTTTCSQINSPPRGPAHLADVESFAKLAPVGEVGKKVVRDGSPLKQPDFLDGPSLLPEDFAEVHAGFLDVEAGRGWDEGRGTRRWTEPRQQRVIHAANFGTAMHRREST